MDTILDTAKGLIYGDRQDQYGDALESFGNIADGWTIILRRNFVSGDPVSAEQVTLMMDWLKTCRLLNQTGHYDSIVDKAGYAGCYEKIQVARTKQDDSLKALLKACDLPFTSVDEAIQHNTNDPALD